MTSSKSEVVSRTNPFRSSINLRRRSFASPRLIGKPSTPLNISSCSSNGSSLERWWFALPGPGGTAIASLHQDFCWHGTFAVLSTFMFGSTKKSAKICGALVWTNHATGTAVLGIARYLGMWSPDLPWYWPLQQLVVANHPAPIQRPALSSHDGLVCIQWRDSQILDRCSVDGRLT